MEENPARMCSRAFLRQCRFYWRQAGDTWMEDVVISSDHPSEAEGRGGDRRSTWL